MSAFLALIKIHDLILTANLYNEACSVFLQYEERRSREDGHFEQWKEFVAPMIDTNPQWMKQEDNPDPYVDNLPYHLIYRIDMNDKQAMIKPIDSIIVSKDKDLNKSEEVVIESINRHLVHLNTYFKAWSYHVSAQDSMKYYPPLTIDELAMLTQDFRYQVELSLSVLSDALFNTMSKCSRNSTECAIFASGGYQNSSMSLAVIDKRSIFFNRLAPDWFYGRFVTDIGNFVYQVSPYTRDDLPYVVPIVPDIGVHQYQLALSVIFPRATIVIHV